jgi:hypothetical protein
LDTIEHLRHNGNAQAIRDETERGGPDHLHAERILATLGARVRSVAAPQSRRQLASQASTQPFRCRPRMWATRCTEAVTFRQLQHRATPQVATGTAIVAITAAVIAPVASPWCRAWKPFLPRTRPMTAFRSFRPDVRRGAGGNLILDAADSIRAVSQHTKNSLCHPPGSTHCSCAVLSPFPTDHSQRSIFSRSL